MAPEKKAPSKKRAPRKKPTIADQAREEVLKEAEAPTRPATTTGAGKQEASGGGRPPNPFGFLRVFAGPQKWIYIAGTFIIVLALFYFLDGCNGNGRDKRKNDKEVARIERENQHLRDSLAIIHAKKRVSDSIAIVKDVIAQAARDDVAQALRNKQITDAQAEQIRQSIKRKTNEIRIKISDAPIRELDSLVEIFKLARRLNQDPND